ncbi:DUF5662 family protein [Anaeromicropila herbilytica]|uniref:Catalase n=1 Tax=Anaeromicropila herbilytica TaxID=2785025 RepID=A0A7R7EHD2_9FIRM|nr:DUF5662 family protein [Anaeromicropila herbilytica]BCN28764.1 hypothetical protein bsdtb5_00590 [Anaeromicropila herbilytica]
MKPIHHFCTITNHKLLVMKYCFRVGLYRQGLLHDLSKYSPTEFIVGIKHYQGTESPNNAERMKKGYSSAWLHHKGRNKHHFEYWIDYSVNRGEGMVGMKMPVKYVAEMFIDRMCASKNYNKNTYTNRHPLEYYEKGKHRIIMNKDTRALLEKLLLMLASDGEDKTLHYIKDVVLRHGY